MVAKARNISDRFWEKVDKRGDCWVWQGFSNPHGYGMFRTRNGNVKAHVMAFVLSEGREPNEAVKQICGNLLCVYPGHLREVSLSESRKRRDPVERFWPQVEKTEACWLFRGISNKGYGSFRDGRGQNVQAHRFSWEIYNGPIPEGLFVLHRCDIRNCVNPGHLFLGTQLDNMKDASEKGRLRRGSNHPNSKLIEAEVRAIRQSSASQRTLAVSYGVDQALISGIKAGKLWKHVA